MSSLSSKKGTKQLIFTTSRLIFVRFLEESEDTCKIFRNYLTFRTHEIYPSSKFVVLVNIDQDISSLADIEKGFLIALWIGLGPQDDFANSKPFEKGKGISRTLSVGLGVVIVTTLSLIKRIPASICSNHQILAFGLTRYQDQAMFDPSS